MKVYELNEYMGKLDDQEKKDKTLMGSCIVGLSTYAMQFKHQHGTEASADKVKEIRDLIVEICGYWALDAFFNTEAENYYLDLFDRYMGEPKGPLYSQPPLSAAATLEGLYRYAMEMVVCQGEDLKNEICRNRTLILEISAFWNCLAPGVNQMCNQIEQALCRMGCDSSEAQSQDIEMKF